MYIYVYNIKSRIIWPALQLSISIGMNSSAWLFWMGATAVAIIPLGRLSMKLWFLFAVISMARLSDRMLGWWLWGCGAVGLSTKCGIVRLGDFGCVVARGSRHVLRVWGFKTLKVLLQSIPKCCDGLQICSYHVVRVQPRSGFLFSLYFLDILKYFAPTNVHQSSKNCSKRTTTGCIFILNGKNNMGFNQRFLPVQTIRLT